MSQKAGIFGEKTGPKPVWSGEAAAAADGTVPVGSQKEAAAPVWRDEGWPQGRVTGVVAAAAAAAAADPGEPASLRRARCCCCRRCGVEGAKMAIGEEEGEEQE